MGWDNQNPELTLTHGPHYPGYLTLGTWNPNKGHIATSAGDRVNIPNPNLNPSSSRGLGQPPPVSTLTHGPTWTNLTQDNMTPNRGHTAIHKGQGSTHLTLTPTPTPPMAWGNHPRN